VNGETIAAEVVDLHEFIQCWFNGTVARSEKDFERLSLAWPAGFTLVSPDNERRTSAELLASTYALHGRFPDLRISIRNVATRIVGGAAVAQYEEWHLDGSETEARLCSATFVIAGEGVQWLHVHESRLVPGDRRHHP